MSELAFYDDDDDDDGELLVYIAAEELPVYYGSVEFLGV